MCRMQWIRLAYSLGLFWTAPAVAELPSWPLPPVHYGDANRRTAAIAPVSFDLARPHSRATPMLDQFFAVSSSFAFQHRRAVATQIGGLDLGIEALRERIVDPFTGGATAQTTRKMFSVGFRAGWTSGRDHFWAGLADARQSSAQPDILVGRRHLLDSEMTLGGGWQHGDHLRFNLDWTKLAGNASAIAAERLAEIARGAPLHESGYRLALEWAPGHAGLAGSPSFGIEARSARLARDDAQFIGTNRPDTRVGLFLRAPF
jgi:hypothetical protein